MWLWMQLLWRPAHGITSKVPDVFLSEGGTFRARGDSPGGQGVLPLSALGVLPLVHGQVPHDTVVQRVDGRRQAALAGALPYPRQP